MYKGKVFNLSEIIDISNTRPILDWEYFSGLWISDFHYFDDYRGFLPIENSLISCMSEGQSVEEITQGFENEIVTVKLMLQDAFTNAGWDGDGVINSFAIPPIFTGDADGVFRFFYHVKQSDNGTSWVAVPTDEWNSRVDAVFESRQKTRPFLDD